jgi:hypothetical protein
MVSLRPGPGPLLGHGTLKGGRREEESRDPQAPVILQNPPLDLGRRLLRALWHSCQCPVVEPRAAAGPGGRCGDPEPPATTSKRTGPRFPPAGRRGGSPQV